MTLSVLTAASALVLFFTWPGDLDRDALEDVEIPAAFLHSAGLLFLAMTAAADLRLGLALRRSGQAAYGTGGWLAASHVLVLTAGLAAAARGAWSRAFLAELHHLVAVLITAASLSLLLLLLVRWRTDEPPAQGPLTALQQRDRRIARLLCLAQVLACLLVVASLLAVETRRLPPTKARHNFVMAPLPACSPETGLLRL